MILSNLEGNNNFLFAICCGLKMIGIKSRLEFLVFNFDQLLQEF